MSRVHHPDPELLACHQDGGYVAADEGEDKLDPVGPQHLGHALAAMPRALGVRLMGRAAGEERRQR